LAAELSCCLVAQRAGVVSQMTWLKNCIQSVLYANLVPRGQGKLFTKTGRTWLAKQPLPEDQNPAVHRRFDELDRPAIDLAAIDREFQAFRPATYQDRTTSGPCWRSAGVGHCLPEIGCPVKTSPGHCNRWSGGREECLVNYSH
jgi:hypothetical protein